ncbi:MAG: polyphosphate polymerase domain-containing protein [Puniceicoccaceae bacterium]|nr:MAG: polyphosphate polymerase domain-containing protein [Puniceicoccaceae bacterium]
MPVDQMQTQRFELKYVIPDALAVQIRDFLAPYMEMDPYGARQPDLSYPVHSLYLDSGDLALHQSTINGDKNRFKLRVRFYENRPAAPVYFEIKRRENNAIYKERCAVRRHVVPEIIAGRLPRRDDFVSACPEDERALHNFCTLMNRLVARPVAHVAYRREAWLSEGANRLRITFDRQVRSCPERTACLEPEMERPVLVFGNEVVLELKFTGRFPTWMRDLVQVFGLRQCSAAKYVDGIVRMEELDRPLPAATAPVIPSHRTDRRLRRQLRASPRFIQQRLLSRAG